MLKYKENQPLCMLCGQHTDALLVPVRCRLLHHVLHNQDCNMLVPTKTLRGICSHVICDSCWFNDFKCEKSKNNNLATKLSLACPSCISTQWGDVIQKLLAKSKLTIYVGH
jgi:hypothetical protein